MNKEIRNYIKENGRAAARKKFGNKIDVAPIMWDGVQVGQVSREWHSIYCTWVFKGVVTYDGTVHSFISTDSQKECLDWGLKKMKALSRPEFGTALKELIDLSGFTQTQVAEEIGCSREVLVKWMKGHSHPSVHFLYRICRLLAVSDWEALHHEFTVLIDLEK